MKQKPLWLPVGSVRSLIALMVVSVSAAGSGFIIAQNAESELAMIIVGGWLATLGSVVQAYFGMRQNENNNADLITATIEDTTTPKDGF